MRSGIHELLTAKSGNIYKQIVKNTEFTSPDRFINATYKKYKSNYGSNASTNGRIFEYLICETLAKKGIKPFYYQAKFALVPNADFDIVLFDPQKPVVLSIKTSLRERYKQADLEGWALRQVYRRAESHLITLDHKDTDRLKDKIQNGEVLGLSSCIIATSPEYNDLLNNLKERSFIQASKIVPCTGKFLE